MAGFWSFSTVGCITIVIIALLISTSLCAGILLHRIFVLVLNGVYHTTVRLLRTKLKHI